MIIWGNGIREPFQKWKLEVLFQSFLSNEGSDLYLLSDREFLLLLFWSLLFLPDLGN